MNAYHVFYQSKDDSEYESINYLIQLSSILFWKKNEGQINLYCNSKFLESIKKYGLDKLYTNINTECLDNIPFQESLSKYWSFCKIHAAKEISQNEKDFVILDTDLWIHNQIFIDTNFQFIGYHSEMKLDHPGNPYISPDNFMSSSDLKLFDWEMTPINCAFMYLNSQELIREWWRWSVKIIKDNKDKEKKDISADTIFIEQRLLPTLANSLEMKVGTLLPNTYCPHIPSDNLGSEWTPKIGFDEDNQYMTWNIKHVWGLKGMYNDPSVRNIVIDTVLDSLDSFFSNWKESNEYLLSSVMDKCYSEVE